MSAVLQTRSPGRLRRLARSPLLRPFNDPVAIEGALQWLNPLWSLGQVRARVLEVVEETPDVRTFVLAPNRHWRGAEAGQHVLVGMEVDGRRCQRAFSLSAPAARGGPLRLTVKRQPDAGVTAWMQAHLRPGAVVALSQAQGGFVLPAAAPPRLLMIGAGSGITPLRAMLLALRARGYDGDVVLLQACRDEADAIFGAELDALAAQWPALTLLRHRSADAGRLDAAALAARVPDFAARTTFLCGPAAMMAWVEASYAEAGAQALLHRERFGLPPRPRAADDAEMQVRCTASERLFTSAGDTPLLLAAEAGGLQPRHGCRIGICMSCQCRKRSGTVENLLTGRVSSAPDELIQLCISAARSDLELEL
ncbi:ferredoxin reductase [Coralloluteibacterium thermophilus]|uniref:Ferredoxin reductase n=1 Tax=Coralloluteibacterium thermophilum TaxID=2707049 RepID=A0ABV9NIB9_9GAMM